MSGFGFLSIVSLFVGMAALWMAWRLRQEFSRIDRERYYLEQKLKSVPLQMKSMVEPLRIQTALLALGKPVSDRLIRSGLLYHEISPQDAEEFLTIDSPTANTLWLDVRTSAEYSKGHIPGAKLIPVEELEVRFQTEIPPTVEKIMVYCASGDRSRLACDLLSRHEFGNVYHLKNGLQAWSGPMEGMEVGGLIQITSKSKLTSQMSVIMLASVYL